MANNTTKYIEKDNINEMNIIEKGGNYLISN